MICDPTCRIVTIDLIFFQNNNRGGYNVGDNGTEAAATENEQYRMVNASM